MIQLHYHPSNASLAPHLLLRELGIPFELKYVDRATGEHKSAAYLKLNPNGLIPVLVDTHPQASLAPAVGTAERAQFYKWLMWLACSVQPTMTHYFYSERMAAPGDAAGAAAVKAAAEGLQPPLV
jgi:glutathione S-transferase